MLDTDLDKCRVKDGSFVLPCRTLLSALHGTNPTGKSKGAYCWEYTDRSTHRPTRRFFGVKSGDYSKDGVAFNFCPFCGEDISAPFLIDNTKAGV